MEGNACILKEFFFDMNPIAPRKAKIVYNFGLSECNRIKRKTIVLLKDIEIISFSIFFFFFFPAVRSRYMHSEFLRRKKIQKVSYPHTLIFFSACNPNHTYFCPPTERFGGYSDEPGIHLWSVCKHFCVHSVT